MDGRLRAKVRMIASGEPLWFQPPSFFPCVQCLAQQLVELEVSFCCTLTETATEIRVNFEVEWCPYCWGDQPDFWTAPGGVYCCGCGTFHGNQRG
jgi:hypothetical protein